MEERGRQVLNPEMMMLLLLLFGSGHGSVANSGGGKIVSFLFFTYCISILQCSNTLRARSHRKNILLYESVFCHFSGNL